MSLRVWLCDLCYTQQLVSSDVIPAAVGELATYCEANVAPAPATRLFKYPDRLSAALREEQPHVIGFSNYIWNFELGHGYAQAIKRKFPRTVVVMGGPNFPLAAAHQEEFLRAHPAIDFYVELEGEVALAELLQALIAHDLDPEPVKRLALGNVRALAADGTFHAGPIRERIKDLGVIPPPYATGRLDEFFDGKLMPLLHTTRGCPFTCTFCVEATSYYARPNRKPSAVIRAEIDHMGRMMAQSCAAGGRNELFLGDSNYGMYKEDLETAQFLAEALAKYRWPEFIICSTGKNQRERVLEASRIVGGRIRISGSVQSTDPEVLDNIKRKNIKMETMFAVAAEANRIGAESYAEVILNLPGDTVERHCNTVGDLIDAGFSNVRMFQLEMLMGSEMYTQYRQGAFGLGTRWRVVPYCYGDHVFDDDTRIVTAAIEEFVTAQASMPFADYLECRTFDLLVETFYNQGVFQGVLKLLAQRGLSRYRWISTIRTSPALATIGAVLEDYRRETSEEGWESSAELREFVSKPENVHRYLRGELGAKLLFKYKAILVNEHLPALAEIARATALQLLASEGKRDEGVEALLDDILAYEVLRKVDLFQGDYAPKFHRLRHDVPAFIAGRDDASLAFAAPKDFKFFFDDGQIHAIERAVNTYGRDSAAMTKILSYLHVSKFHRHCELAG